MENKIKLFKPSFKKFKRYYKDERLFKYLNAVLKSTFNFYNESTYYLIFFYNKKEKRYEIRIAWEEDDEKFETSNIELLICNLDWCKKLKNDVNNKQYNESELLYLIKENIK